MPLSYWRYRDISFTAGENNRKQISVNEIGVREKAALFLRFQEAQAFGHRRLGKNVAARAARTKLFVVVEFLVNPRNLSRNIIRVHDSR